PDTQHPSTRHPSTRHPSTRHPSTQHLALSTQHPFSEYDPPMRRLIIKGLTGVVAFVVLVLVAGYAYVRRSLPAVDGDVTVPGISAAVEIIRDADAIP